MLLAIDIGNSHIVLGCLNGDTITKTLRIVTDTKKTEDQYAAEIKGIFDFSGVDCRGFGGAIIASVVPPVTSALRRAVKRLTGISPLMVGAGIKTGLNIHIEDASELGADAVCVSVAALAKYGAPCAVIDLGTATKILVLDHSGTYIGGAIAPGVAISADALTSRASLLPSVSLDAPKRAISGVTAEAMKSGIVFGAAAMVDGMLRRFKAELGMPLRAVATGGIAPSIIPHCAEKITLDENLILDGLRLIYEKNRK
ncbi:MAG: type III pantothenate kinase [Oscillospiraceae bacterium]|jgi:type III pantothenate kinase|nr:type III pantothenate kinase [Oscillospiraceae bacterium]